ncbi:DUF1810 domain-containing protein [Tersicoccus sp. Bi-70]|uniref:DUF1810 domain-containing protein n=1 Tax=Tersicoccus sp. Bi-70 TaxID=1897634 RepID=UPI00097822FC|nr:DUF1810 domain-containing protein [Tersicoccus sp. Bi-70]OMH34368.1 calpastatin [Tersicoccus sp. Bi-70]
MTPHAGDADLYDLERFVRAQDDGTWETALAELERGRKSTHWMWFVFPQIAGLGRSPMAQRYAIASLDEARAYLRHPLLGARLHQAAQAVVAADGTAEEILGGIDAVKLRSSMTLFARADPEQDAFPRVLDHFFDGEADPATLALL